MPRCPGCGFPYNVKRGPCLECGRDLTLPLTTDEEKAESQRRQIEAERAEQARQREPTRMERWVLSSIAVVMFVVGIPLLLLAGCTTLVGWSGIDEAYPPDSFGQVLSHGLFEAGLLGALVAVVLLVIAVAAWRQSD